MTQVFKKLTILTMCIISFTSIFGCFAISGKPTDKVQHHLEKIKEINYKHSLKKIDATLAAKKMVIHMIAIEKLNKKISDIESIKELLTSFIEKWNSEAQILGSLKDGNHFFMIEVNAFFIRGHVKTKDGWKTLFPIFKP
jgi:hypothetical protein